MSDRELRWMVHLATLVTLLALLANAMRVHAQEEDASYVYTAADTLAAIDQASVAHGVSWRWLYSIVRCESQLDPYAVGRRGELGAAQLAPWGELRRFYARGFSNPYSPYQAVAFLAQRLNEGGARAWACA